MSRARRLHGLHPWHLLRGLYGLLVLGAALWPLVYAIWISFTPGDLLEPPRGEWSLRWYRLFLSSPQWTDGLWNSMRVAGLTVIGSLLGGVGAAVAVTRYHFRGARLLSGVVLLPLFVPAVVLGMALLPFVRVIGLWGSRLSLAAAHSLWSLPVVFLMVRAALEEADPELERAARGLGASPLQTFFRITIPLIAPALLTGALLASLHPLAERVHHGAFPVYTRHRDPAQGDLAQPTLHAHPAGGGGLGGHPAADRAGPGRAGAYPSPTLRRAPLPLQIIRQ